ncbi:MAG: hypothetical protein JWP97_1537 [Labilithrix sp.]|nr:hypothetical protein [Labilithrix sp.]
MKKDLLAYALAAVPLVGIIELVLHVKETTSDVVPGSDWDAARDAVKAELKPDDLVLFAPFWADPVGREHFGEPLAGLKREARPDETRFARTFEVSIRGAHRPELAGWRKASERSVGKVTIGVYENPAPVKLHQDLVDLVTPERMTVWKTDGASESPCPFQRTTGQAGGLGVPQGPAIPGDRFVCSGGAYVGVGVLHALDHQPHLCVFVSPQGAGSMKVRFGNVAFGSSLHGHSGVQWVNERTPSQERISLAFSAFDRPLGTNVHRVGAGWTGFELPTPDLVGRTGDLVAEITGAAPREYCFEADTRDVP